MKKTLIILLLVLIVLSIALPGCSQPPRPSPNFHRGEIVKSVIGEHQGQITRVFCLRGDEQCTYHVRFMLGDDSISLVQEFELRKL